MPTVPAVSADTLGAWLLKAGPADGAVAELARNGFEDVATRCVRPSYRTRLVVAEVLRVAAGSNPSYLDAAQYAALREAFPQVDRRDRPGTATA